MTRRLLHLIDASAPAAAAVLTSLARGCGDMDHRAVVVGSAALAGELAGDGLSVVGEWSPYTLWRRRLPQDVGVIAWSARCAAAVAWRRRPIAWVAFESPSWWTTMLLRRGGVALCFDQRHAGELAARGLAVERVEPLVDPTLIGQADRGAWACEGRDRVVALLSDDPRRADAMTGVVALSLAAEAGIDQPDAPHWRMLAHPDSQGLLRARRLVDRTHRPGRLLVDPAMDRPWRLLGSCDAALLIGPETTLAAAWCSAAGVPAVTLGSITDAHRAADALRRLPFSTLNAKKPARMADPAAWRRVIETRLTS